MEYIWKLLDQQCVKWLFFLKVSGEVFVVEDWAEVWTNFLDRIRSSVARLGFLAKSLMDKVS
jgi:hypothetical protein